MPQKIAVPIQETDQPPSGGNRQQGNSTGYPRIEDTSPKRAVPERFIHRKNQKFVTRRTARINFAF